MRKLIDKISKIYRRFKYNGMLLKEARRQQKAAKEHYFKIEEAHLFVDAGIYKGLKAWDGIVRATYLPRPNRLITIDGIDIRINFEKINGILKERF